MPVARRGLRDAPARDQGVEPPRPHAQTADERIGGAAVVQHPGVAALARGDRGAGQLPAEAEPAAAEGDREARAAAEREAGLLAVGDGDGDGAVGALLADQRLVLADVEDEDPRAHRVVAAGAADRARSAVLLAVAAARDAQRAQQLAVDRPRERRAVGDERHRPQDHRHDEQDADVVDAGLAAVRRSWEALWGHLGTVAAIA